MFSKWCREKFGGVRLALVVYSVLLCSLVIILDLIFSKIELSSGGYILLGGIIAQIVTFNWEETKRPTGDKNVGIN